MTLLDEAKGLAPVPVEGEYYSRHFMDKKVYALEQRLAIAVRALREEGNRTDHLNRPTGQAIYMRALADALSLGTEPHEK